MGVAVFQGVELTFDIEHQNGFAIGHEHQLAPAY